MGGSGGGGSGGGGGESAGGSSGGGLWAAYLRLLQTQPVRDKYCDLAASSELAVGRQGLLPSLMVSLC